MSPLPTVCTVGYSLSPLRGCRARLWTYSMHPYRADTLVRPTAPAPGGHIGPPLLATRYSLLATRYLSLDGPAEIGAFDLGMAQQVGAGTVQHDLAAFEDIGIIGHGQRLEGVLLDQQDGAALGVQLADQVEDLAHQQRGQAHRRLVE